MSGCNLQGQTGSCSVDASHQDKRLILKGCPPRSVSRFRRRENQAHELTDDADHQLVGGVISAHQQGVVDDEVAGQEVGVAVDGGPQDGLAVGADVQRVVVDQLEQVLVQQHHLAALLPRVGLHVPVPQGALQVKHLHRIQQLSVLADIQTYTS